METMGLHFVASGMYVAFSTNESMLESYLRSAKGPGRPLKSKPEFQQAVNAVGGFKSGYVYYQSLESSVGLMYENVRENPESLFSGLMGMGTRLRIDRWFCTRRCVGKIHGFQKTASI